MGWEAEAGRAAGNKDVRDRHIHPCPVGRDHPRLQSQALQGTGLSDG